MSPELVQALGRLPSADKVLVVLSGGLDSTAALRLAVQRYGKRRVSAVSFRYGQRQEAEIDCARRICERLGVKWTVHSLPFMVDIGRGKSANLDRSIAMPSISEVLGDPKPVTYIPNRNMILLAVAVAQAEADGAGHIICGFQSNDTYGFWDTTPQFLDRLNDVYMMNRQGGMLICAPFANLSKADEIRLIRELDGNVDLLADTLTCYNPTSTVVPVPLSQIADVPKKKVTSCGACPSCAERIANFGKAGTADPIEYQIKIDWDTLLHHFGENA